MKNEVSSLICGALLSVASVAAAETETWYDSEGRAMELAKTPEAPPQFIPQWVAREAARGFSTERSRRFGGRWNSWEAWDHAGWGFGSVRWGHRVWVAPQRVCRTVGARSWGVRTHREGCVGGRSYGIHAVFRSPLW